MLKQFPPGYFALVMATGIVSIACDLAGLKTVALGLFVVNVAQYAFGLACSIGRLCRYPRLMWQDLVHHAKGPGFLTLVAGTNIVGVQFALIVHVPVVFIALWMVGCALWLLLMYLMLAGVTIAKEKPGLETGLNGSWLLCTVSSASVCILGTFVAAYWGNGGVAERLLFLCVVAYLIGIALYIVIISQIFYRWIFLEMEPEELSPSYWINMGALAISTLAGARLLLAGAGSPLVHSLHGFIMGMSLFVGAFACWWIPFLVILYVYRRIAYGIRISYNLQNWSVVFPLGMFCVASFNFLPLLGQGWLLPAIHVFVVVALLAWVLTFIGMARRIPSAWRQLRAR